MGSKGSHRTCEICGVKERHKHCSGSLLFAAIPLNVDRCREWLRIIGNAELVHLPIEKLHMQRHVCGNHFQKKDFNKKGNRLKKHAIPSLNLTAVPLSDDELREIPQHVWKETVVSLPEELPSTSKCASVTVVAEQLLNAPLPEELPSTSRCMYVDDTPVQLLNVPSLEGLPLSSKCTHIDVAAEQTEQPLNELTPRKKKLVKQLIKTKCTLKSLRKSAILVEKIDSPNLKEFVQNACKNQGREPKGRRWTTKNKFVSKSSRGALGRC